MKVGKVSESVLKRSVLKPIKNRRTEMINGAGVGGDCAIFALSTGENCVTCMQEGRLILSGIFGEESEDRKAALQEEVIFQGVTPSVSLKHLMVKCVNNLTVAGAEPLGVQITLLLPTYIEEPNIKDLMREAEAAAEELNLQIMGGQTRISETVTAPWAVLTGYGKTLIPVSGKTAKKTGEIVPLSGIRPGQDIVVSKWIGLEGTAILARHYREGLLTRYPAYLVEDAEEFEQYFSIRSEAATAIKSGVCAMHDASEGGIFAALWELAEAAGVGLTIDMKKLPLRQETVEVCEYCNVNPYELLSGGCLVMATEDGLGLAAALEAEHIPATVVGKVTDSKDRILINGDETRYMDRPRTDEIYKFCK